MTVLFKCWERYVKPTLLRIMDWISVTIWSIFGVFLKHMSFHHQSSLLTTVLCSWCDSRHSIWVNMGDLLQRRWTQYNPVFLSVVQSIGSISPVCKYLNFPVKLWGKWVDSELFDMSKRTCFLFWETANLFLITFSKNPQSEADTSMWNFSPYGRVWWN